MLMSELSNLGKLLRLGGLVLQINVYVANRDDSAKKITYFFQL